MLLRLDSLFRTDRADLQGPVASLRAPVISGVTATFEGVVARVHKIGDPLVYDGGKRLEYRDVDGLRELARQLVGRSVVVKHPTKGTGRLRESPEKTVVGTVTGVRMDGDLAIASIKITHNDGLAAIRAGMTQLSAGYGAGTDPAGFQRVFDTDHLALVAAARCGPTCSIRADMHDACQCGCSMQDSNPVMDPTQTEALRSLEAQRAEAEARANSAETQVNSEKLRADTAEGKIAVLEQEISDLKVKIAAGATAVETEAVVREKMRADQAEAKVIAFDKTYETRLRQRSALERKAAVVLGDDFRMDSLDDREIMATVVKKLDAGADVTAAVPDGVIVGRFLASTERHAASSRALARVAEISAPTQRADAAEERKAKRTQAWREPLPNAAKK